MNGARGPSGVCPGDVCDWVRERSGLWERGWLQAGSTEPAEGKEKRRTRPINSAIVANQDHPGEGQQFGSALTGERRGVVKVVICKILRLSDLCGVVFGGEWPELCCFLFYLHHSFCVWRYMFSWDREQILYVNRPFTASVIFCIKDLPVNLGLMAGSNLVLIWCPYLVQFLLIKSEFLHGLLFYLSVLFIPKSCDMTSDSVPRQRLHLAPAATTVNLKKFMSLL